MSPSSPYGNFVLLCLVSLVLWWHALAATFGLALRNAAYTHILLILPISIALIVSEWRSPKVQPEPNFRSGLALLVLAVLIGVAGRGWCASRRTWSGPWHVGGRHLVDGVVRLLFRQPDVPNVCFSGSLAQFVGKRAVEKAAPWKSPKAGLSPSA
jgi:hypothetical protein